MRVKLVCAALAAFSAASADGQTLSPGRTDENGAIVVRGTPTKGAKAEMSDWRLAETPHVLVFGKGEPARITRLAANLETLHFLLSMLLNRVDAPDDTIKLAVTLIGDSADFNQLELTNLRWQQGPYPRAFPSEFYYDPREDGAVMATTATDQTIVLQPGTSLASLGGLVPEGEAGDPSAPPGMRNAYSGPSGAAASVNANEVGFPWSAEGRIYAGFARHYLLTYFPNAYPRWYLDGFGEIFSTLAVPGPGVVEYGQPPEGIRKVTEWFSRYRLKDVLSGRYLTDTRSRPQWTPYDAWALAHLLFFDEAWKQPLHDYLAAVARGAPPEEAAKVLGDTEKLARQLSTYRGRKVPVERMTFPRERVATPLVRQLARSEAGYVRGRLELGARIGTAEAGGAKAIARRDSWLDRVRRDAQRFPSELEMQLLLAEAECRSGNADLCLAAADRALAIAPNHPPALAWKGIALARAASSAPGGERDSKLRAARALIVRANRTDPELVLPLLGYFRSFAEAGQAPPPAALDGLNKVVESVPAAPAPRVMLGTALARTGSKEDACRIVRPVLYGPYDSPEREKARAAGAC